MVGSDFVNIFTTYTIFQQQIRQALILPDNPFMYGKRIHRESIFPDNDQRGFKAVGTFDQYSSILGKKQGTDRYVDNYTKYD